MTIVETPPHWSFPCMNQSRSERIISSENHLISETKMKIASLEKLIASKDSELNHLKSNLAASEERRSQAEVDLKAERKMEGSEQPLKKQKTK